MPNRVSRLRDERRPVGDGGAPRDRADTQVKDVPWPSTEVGSWLALNRSAGNRAVARALAGMPATSTGTRTPKTVQRAPDEDSPKSGHDAPAGGSDLKLPWIFGDHTAFELTSSGIRFLVAVGKNQQAAVKSVVAALGARIAADNGAISDAGQQVRTCFITAATTRFAYWGTQPVLMLDPSEADVATVAHEMGHAVMESLVRADARASAPGVTIPARVADLYLRLQATHGKDADSPPAGLEMVDPSEWSPGAKSEHPWENADEFFASAKAAFQVSPKGLAKSIARATKVDPAVGPLAKELLAILDAMFGKATMPKSELSPDRAKAAAGEVKRFRSASQIEDSIAIYPVLGWLIHPESRPRGR